MVRIPVAFASEYFIQFRFVSKIYQKFSVFSSIGLYFNGKDNEFGWLLVAGLFVVIVAQWVNPSYKSNNKV
jgi:hypothetical protein